MNLYKFFLKALRDDRGATAVEYGLIIAMIVIVMILSLEGVANEIIAMWGDVENDVSAV